MCLQNPECLSTLIVVFCYFIYFRLNLWEGQNWEFSSKLAIFTHNPVFVKVLNKNNHIQSSLMLIVLLYISLEPVSAWIFSTMVLNGLVIPTSCYMEVPWEPHSLNQWYIEIAVRVLFLNTRFRHKCLTIRCHDFLALADWSPNTDMSCTFHAW